MRKYWLEFAMMSETGINQVILYVPLLPSGNLLLVERVDGRIYIVRNDELLTNRSWVKTEAAQAVNVFKTLKESAALKRFPNWQEGRQPK